MNPLKSQAIEREPGIGGSDAALSNHSDHRGREEGGPQPLKPKYHLRGEAEGEGVGPP